MISHLKQYFKPVKLKQSTGYIYQKNTVKIVCLSNRFFLLSNSKVQPIDQSQVFKTILRAELFN